MTNNHFKSMNSDEIYHALKKDILNLRLTPGQLISENEISKKYNVSRTPVKTAFLRLSSEKYIEIVPQKGTYVTLLDMELIKEIIYMRTVLETTVIKGVLGNVPAEILCKLSDNLKKQEEIVKQPDIDPSEFYKIDSQFHGILFDFAGKTRLWQIIQEFQVYYTRFRMLDIVAVGRFDRLYEEHCELFDIIKSGDKERLDEMMERHLHGNINRLGDKIHNELKDYFM
ncbi:GntR family transcriptional regulator [Geosporobacter ferrireducens]|uniref:GntR family transcriptional regulator n=1 Tax=Geosporobacter ferrireducens TaxID=1424294 RepID=A0A1D8GIE8_9FIRM|nr:GntR family transcriptional regulator [Geosporobacter ferrireducens]AOT70703.1 GntR family transcriptional regulator [Geosporobacter ferrireducens]MTI57509.1 GntR family transcriptional regulator [Geosporobacter ferrireducens]